MRLLNILKEDNIIKASLEDSLTSVLNKLSTSHDAAFVFDKEKFLGVISPYYTIIKNSYPVNTKVINCLFHPPKIYLNYPIAKVCQLFIESKVHYLPVFNKDGKFVGIISARRVLKHIKSLPIFKKKISQFIKYKKLPVLIFEDSKLGEALNIFKKIKVSKLIVVDRNYKLKGILAYYDLINLITQPKTRENRGDRLGIKTSLMLLSIKNYYKKNVLCLSSEDNLLKVIDLILEKKIGSVIIIDKDKKPLNIITTQDIFHYFINEETNFFKQISLNIGKLLLKNKTSNGN